MNNFNTAKTEDSTTTWLTPPDLLKSLGTFDVDVCCPENMPWTTANKMYTIKDDGLKQEWKGRVWCNPPYGRESVAFLKKMSEHKEGGLCLIFVRSDTKAWHEYILNSAKYLFLFKGRLKFYRIDGKQGLSANAPSCLVAWNHTEYSVLKKLEDDGKGKLITL